MSSQRQSASPGTERESRRENTRSLLSSKRPSASTRQREPSNPRPTLVGRSGRPPETVPSSGAVLALFARDCSRQKVAPRGAGSGTWPAVPAASSFLRQWGHGFRRIRAAPTPELNAPTLDTLGRRPRGAPGVETPDEPRTTIADDPRPIFMSRSLRRLGRRRRLRRQARHVADALAGASSRGLGLTRLPSRERDIRFLGRERTRRTSRSPPFGSFRESANRADPETLFRRAARRERSNAYRTFGGEPLREEQNAAAGSRCLPSRGPDAAISRGTDGRVTCGLDWRSPEGGCLEQRLLAAREEEKLALLRGLFPREGDDLQRRECLFYRLTDRRSERDRRPRGSSEASANAHLPAALPNQLDFND